MGGLERRVGKPPGFLAFRQEPCLSCDCLSKWLRPHSFTAERGADHLALEKCVFAPPVWQKRYKLLE